jgi:hypothetical protein
MTTANVVFSGPARNVDPIKRSAKIASGVTVLPGALVELNGSGEWILHNSQGHGFDVHIADMNVIEQKAVTDALTAGDTAAAFVPEVGCTYNLVLAASQTIAKGAPLTSNGSGAVEAATVTGATPDEVLFIAEEAVTTTGATGRIRARHVAAGVPAAS